MSTLHLVNVVRALHFETSLAGPYVRRGVTLMTTFSLRREDSDEPIKSVKCKKYFNGEEGLKRHDTLAHGYESYQEKCQ